MPWVEFEPTILASERAKAIHALDRAATVTGIYCNISFERKDYKMNDFNFSTLLTYKSK
jgi:hypothetical protein